MISKSMWFASLDAHNLALARPLTRLQAIQLHLKNQEHFNLNRIPSVENFVIGMASPKMTLFS